MKPPSRSKLLCVELAIDSPLRSEKQESRSGKRDVGKERCYVFNSGNWVRPREEQSRKECIFEEYENLDK
jgi:hypothetical protein